MAAQRQTLRLPRSRPVAALAVLALAVPLPAHALSLPQLLAMPLEDLLRLRVTEPARAERHIRVTASESAPAGFWRRS